MFAYALVFFLMFEAPASSGPSEGNGGDAGLTAVLPLETDGGDSSHGKVCVAKAPAEGKKMFLIGLRAGKSCLGKVEKQGVPAIGGGSCTTVKLQASCSSQDLDVALAHWKFPLFSLLPRTSVEPRSLGRLLSALDRPSLLAMARRQAGDWVPQGKYILSSEPRSTFRITGKTGGSFTVTHWDLVVTEGQTTTVQPGPVFVTSGKRSVAIGGLCSGEPAVISLDGQEFLVAEWGCCECGQRFKDFHRVEGDGLTFVSQVSYGW
jgi:hypothetical protein